MSDDTNPYVGPRSFTRAERRYFFGREREARDLLAPTISDRLVQFYAQSGAGKSSLINTSLIPDLIDKGFLVLPIGRVSGDIPPEIGEVENIFVFNLLISLDQSRADPQQYCHLTIAEFLENLSTTDGEYFFYDDSPAEEDEGDYEEPAHVLIIDQFEEIFTTHLAHWEQRAAFFRQLEHAMDRDPLLWVVLVMREDYVASLDPYVTITANRMRARQSMQRMSFEAALEAVKKPAELAGRPFAPGVAEELVDNLRLLHTPGGETNDRPATYGEFIEPVQLQVVCYQLWEQLKQHPGEVITHEDLRRLARGGELALFINRALGDYYEQALKKVLANVEVSERQLRGWFSTRLITEAETRGYIYQGEETTGGLPNKAMELLKAEYLIRSEPKAGGTWIELVHDRFVGPILRNNRAWEARNQNPLILDAEAWESAGRDPGRLYEGKQLNQALAQAQAHPEDVTEVVRAFLSASEDAAQKKAAARQRRITRIAVGVAGALAVLTIWAVISSIAAISQRNTALNLQAPAEAAAVLEANLRATAEAAARNEAEARGAAEEGAQNEALARAAAEKAADEEAEARQRAEDFSNQLAEALQAAEAARAVAQSRELAAQANIALDNQTDPAALLAVEAYRKAPTVEAKNVLLSLLEQSFSQSFQPVGRPIPTQATDVFSVALSPDGEHLAWGLGNGQVVLWNYRQQLAERRINLLTTPVLGLAFSPNGRTVAAGDQTSRVILIDVQSGAVDELPGVVNSILSLAFHPDGNLLAAAMGTSVRLWDLESRTWLPLEHRFGEFVRSVAWSPDGTRLAAGAQDRQVVVWEAPFTSEPPTTQRQHSGAVLTVAWAADNRTLASSHCLDSFSDRGEIRPLFELVSPVEQTAAPAGHSDFILALAFHPDLPILATGSQDTTILLWDLDSGTTIDLPLIRHQTGVTSLGFSPDGTLLASASEDRELVLWDVATRQPIGIPLTGSPAAINALYFNLDQNHLYAGDASGALTSWDVSFDSWIARACELAERNLTQAKFNQYFPDEAYRSTCPE